MKDNTKREHTGERRNIHFDLFLCDPLVAGRLPVSRRNAQWNASAVRSCQRASTITWHAWSYN